MKWEEEDEVVVQGGDHTVGLSVVLDVSRKSGGGGGGSSGGRDDMIKKSTMKVINKATMIKPARPSDAIVMRSFQGRVAASPVVGGFLDACFLCRQKLLPGKDIYMYKGDRAFCSEDCRNRQIELDEEEMSIMSLAPAKRSASSSSSTERRVRANNC